MAVGCDTTREPASTGAARFAPSVTVPPPDDSPQPDASEPTEDTTPDTSQDVDPPEEDVVPDEPDLPPPCEPSDEVCDGADNDCDGMIDEAQDVEALVQDDPEHCGACGNSCSVKGMVNICVEGQCVTEGCRPRHFDLDGDPDNGCEVRAETPRSNGLRPAAPQRTVVFDPWYAVLDGEAVWLYLASTDELVDVLVLPGAVDAAFDAERNLLVVAGVESISVLDVTDAGLKWRGWFEAPGNELMRVAVHNKHAFVANNFNQLGDSRFFVFDLNDPSNPTVAHRAASLRGTTDVAIYRDDLMVTVSASTGLSIYDISDPTRPTILSFDYYRAFPSNGLAVDRDRGLAYVISTNGGVHIFDLTDINDVVRVGEITERTFGQYNAGLMVDGDSLWVSDYAKLRRFDMRNVQTPRRTKIQSLPGAGHLHKLGDDVLVTMFRSWNFPINRYNINGGSVERFTRAQDGTLFRPIEVAYDGQASQQLTQLHRLGDNILLVERSGQAFIHTPIRDDQGQLTLGQPVWQGYLGLYTSQVVGDKLHTITWSYTGQQHRADYIIFGIDDPAQGLREEVRQDFPCYQSGVIPYNLLVTDTRAYVLCGGWDLRHVEQLDLSDPQAPFHIGRLESPLPVFHLATTGGQLITSVERRVFYRTVGRLEGFRTPVSDLNTPNWSYSAQGLTTGMSIHGPTLYLKTDQGMEMMDVSIDDGYVPLELPPLPGPAVQIAPPPVALDGMALLSTAKGAVLMRNAAEGAFEPPQSLGQLTDFPLLPIAATRLDDTVIILEPRRVLTIPLTTAP